MAGILGRQQSGPILGGMGPTTILGMPTFATMYPEVVAGQTLPAYRPSEEQRAAMLREVLPDLAPVQIIKGVAGGLGNLAMQANEAMPWGGGSPSAVGLYPDGQAPESYPQYAAGGMDPSVMVPFAADAAGMATTGSLAAPAVRNATGMGIRAYHGSPHDFDRFSLDKIGTGEGAQAYGHGLYFAESPGVAKSYRDALSGSQTGKVEISGEADFPGNWADRLFETVKNEPNPADADGLYSLGEISSSYNGFLNAVNDFADGKELRGPGSPDWSPSSDYYDAGYDRARRLLEESGAQRREPGRMYEVDIDASPDEFLDWDKPLSEQPESIRRALGWTPEAEAAYNKAISSETDSLLAELEGRGTYTPTKAPVPKGVPPLDATGAEIMKGTSVFDNVAGASMSEKMRNAGIKGIRYKDAGSRSAEGGTFNYVVFDDKNINILKKYGIAGLMAGGAGAAMLGGTDDASAASTGYTTGGRF